MSDTRVRGAEVIDTSLPLDLAHPSAEPYDNPDLLERRIAPRSIPLESRSSLGWWEGRAWVAFTARLINISRAGIAVEMKVRPPNDREVGFQLGSQDNGERLWGEVVGVKAGRRGRFLVRIAFWSPCPEHLYRAALDGPLGGQSGRPSG